MSSAELKILREDIKSYIDTADEKMLRMIHVLLETEPVNEGNWWDMVPDNIKKDIQESISDADRDVVFSHEQIKEQYPEWFLK